MSVRSSPDNPPRAKPAQDWPQIYGWIAVALAALTGALFGMFMGGETAGEGVLSWGHLIQVGMVVGLACLSIAYPRFGLAVALLGLFLVIRFRGGAGSVVGVPLVLAGLLFMGGNPRPRRLAYWIAGGVPVGVSLLAWMVGALLH